MDLAKALREGPTFVRNAEDSLQRNITNPDLLYLWDNQVAVIDSYLADTENLDGEADELPELRGRLRELKKQLERKVMEFEAQQEGEEVPEEPPAEELVEDFKAVAGDIVAMGDEALGQKIKDVSQLATLEDPRDLINGFLADTEPYKSDKELAQVRDEVRARKEQLDARIRSITEEWRQKDLAESR